MSAVCLQPEQPPWLLETATTPAWGESPELRRCPEVSDQQGAPRVCSKPWAAVWRRRFEGRSGSDHHSCTCWVQEKESCTLQCSRLKQLVCVFIQLFILFVQWNSNRKRTFISSIKLWYQTTAVKHLFYELNSDVKARSLTCWVTDSHSVMMEWLDLTCQTSTLSSHERCFKTEWASNMFQNLRQFVPSVLP